MLIHEAKTTTLAIKCWKIKIPSLRLSNNFVLLKPIYFDDRDFPDSFTESADFFWDTLCIRDGSGKRKMSRMTMTAASFRGGLDKKPSNDVHSFKDDPKRALVFFLFSHPVSLALISFAGIPKNNFPAKRSIWCRFDKMKIENLTIKNASTIVRYIFDMYSCIY